MTAQPDPSVECNCASGRGAEHCIVHAQSVSPAVEGGLPEPSKAERIARERVGAGRICVGSDLHLLEMLLADLDEARRRLATPEQPGYKALYESQVLLTEVANRRAERAMRLFDSQPGSAVQGEDVTPTPAAWLNHDDRGYASLTVGKPKHPGPRGAIPLYAHPTPYRVTTPPPALAAEQGEFGPITGEDLDAAREPVPQWHQPEARGVEELAKGLRETAQRLEGLHGGKYTEWSDRARECRQAADLLATPNPVRAEQPEGKGA